MPHGNVAVGATRMELSRQVVAIVKIPLSVVGAHAHQELDSLSVEPSPHDSGNHSPR